MPQYIYTAKSYDGKTKGGTAEVPDEKVLAQQLRSEGFLITSVKAIEERKEKVKIDFSNYFTSVPLKEKMMFARNLRVMISSGLPISRAVNNLAIQTRNKSFKKILLEINGSLQKGQSLSASLAKYPRVFNDLFVSMVRIGEASGNLEEILDIVAKQLEKEHELLSKVRGAMIYPAVIILAMIGISILMLTYILPQIMGVFKDMDVTLPRSTQAIVDISNFMQNHSILVVAGSIGLIIFFIVFGKSATGKKTISFLTIKMPIISNIVIKVNCARFSRIYSSLLRSGVTVLDALNIIGDTLSNYYYKEAIKNSVEQIQKGTNLSAIIIKYPKIFPVLVPQMIEVGEETGKTEEVLAKLAEFYEEEVSQITKNLSSIIEPVLMIVIGVAVGFFAIAMLQPMYSLMENIK
jgi:type II secretory pathway component PulF